MTSPTRTHPPYVDVHLTAYMYTVLMAIAPIVIYGHCSPPARWTDQYSDSLSEGVGAASLSPRVGVATARLRTRPRGKRYRNGRSLRSQKIDKTRSLERAEGISRGKHGADDQ